MIKNIVFDMGNVLLDYNPNIPLEEFCSTNEEKDIIMKELFEGPEWVLGDRGIIKDAQRYDYVKERVPEKYWGALKLCCDKWDICMTPIKGAREFCERMKQIGYRIYVLSNASDKFYEYFINFAPLEYFDGIVVSADVEIIKPDASIYEHLLQKYDLQADECFFIDDRLENVEGAIAVGMQAYQFDGDYEKLKVYFNEQIR